MKQLVILLVLLSAVILGCQENKEQDKIDDKQKKFDENADLNSFQSEACEAADENDTCDRLDSLGIVYPEQCCKKMGLCCEK